MEATSGSVQGRTGHSKELILVDLDFLMGQWELDTWVPLQILPHAQMPLKCGSL